MKKSNEIMADLHSMLSKNGNIFLTFEKCLKMFGRYFNKIEIERKAEKKGMMITLYNGGFLITSTENVEFV